MFKLSFLRRRFPIFILYSSWAKFSGNGDLSHFPKQALLSGEAASVSVWGLLTLVRHYSKMQKRAAGTRSTQKAKVVACQM